jgi:phosphoglycerate dehydrogenase-like enzyme
LVEETGVPGENPWPATNHWQTLSHKIVLSTPHHAQSSNNRLEAQVKRYKTEADEYEKMEDELKTERRKLQREVF